jgi:hypothetical protein
MIFNAQRTARLNFSTESNISGHQNRYLPSRSGIQSSPARLRAEDFIPAFLAAQRPAYVDNLSHDYDTGIWMTQR